MSLHYLNGIITENETIQAINKNAFNKGIKQLNKPEFKTPFTMNNYDVNDCLIYPIENKNKKAAVNGWFDDAIDNISSTVQAATTNVTSTLSTAAQNVASTLNTGVQNVLTTSQQALNTIQSQGAAALSNTTATIQQGLNNIQVPPFFQQNLNEMWAEVQAFVGKYGKKIALQPLRTAFLICVSANFLRTGTNLANGWNKDKTKITNWWVDTWGGDINALKDAINRSSDIKLNGVYIGEPVTLATVTAAATAASAVLVSVAGILKSLGFGVQEIQDGIKSIVPPKKAPVVTATSPSVETLPAANATFPETTQEQSNKTMLYVGIGGALLVGGYLLMKKRK